VHIDDLLRQMADLGASDLYVRTASPPMARVSGTTEPTCPAALTNEQVNQLADQVLSPRDRTLFERDCQVDLSYAVPNLGRFRANVYLQRGQVGMVFRRINSNVPDLDTLGLPEALKTLSLERRGLILVTGATGSGKSTTLAAMIDYRNAKTTGHILTIEDPIEFVHPHKGCIVNQREIGAHTESFATALRAALREDPDVILVGEMRDLETISLAVSAAETGHLVFGTLHTSSAPQTVDRIIDVFPPHQQSQVRSQLAESIRGIVAQQLIRTTDGTGRAAALEIMTGTPAVRNLIREGKTYQLQSVIQTAVKEGMQTLDQSLRDLIRAGRITLEDALKKVSDKEAFHKLLEEVPGRREPAAAGSAAGPDNGAGFNGGMLIGVRK
jgi:twitching motility protein PilT